MGFFLLKNGYLLPLVNKILSIFFEWFINLLKMAVEAQYFYLINKSKYCVELHKYTFVDTIKNKTKDM